ncbi:helix-turn-helix transcriptional regulator [Mitsuaria sp. 7]|uniref:helix-turn-helix transcriptional regulator n=1 Tax=Mitsuaria sp. 7 TaxID=1658665 RepID=UPI0007DD503A|nr:AraC family transcriptional regulator [Mitsuaria sp. 7]ANH69216.1 AraC family transcriptional regulator [Mitsuaria sp. 7]
MSIPPELPENLLKRDTSGRSWNGVLVEVTEFTCGGRVLHQMRHGPETRLGVILEEVGRGRCEPRLSASTPCPVDYRPRHMHFAPADIELWGYTADARFVKDVSLSFDMATLCERLQIPSGTGLLDVPRLRFTDDRVWSLAKLLAEAVQDPDPGAQLYGDSLIAAIAARLLEPPKTADKPAAGLSPRQLRDAIMFLDSQLPARVDLATLAALAGLSQSHYSRAFKASTGIAPYQWQLQARIERAKSLLVGSVRSLEEVAEATGFADAVHFGRTFRKLTGATPAAWRADRLA